MTRILAIETSCDETAAAIVEDGRRVISNVVHTQIPLHQRYGGVVPEIAARNHTLTLRPVVDKSLQDADISLSSLDAIAVTYGPGLVGALLTGLSYAKGLALALDKPLIGINHIEGHIAANYLSHPTLQPPFTCLIVSGGHSHIVHVQDYTHFRLIGKTRDDAAGEVFDKIARALGLPYPGGPSLEALAQSGNPQAIRFPSAFNEGDSFDFSFSGIKTTVINYLHTQNQREETINLADVAASFQQTVVSVLANKAARAADGSLALAGGVAANNALRIALGDLCQARNIPLYVPDLQYCTDNAAMIASAAYYRFIGNDFSPLSLNAVPNLSIV
jgi:N6-L-threonylcarbamoyladenine synthase